ncbi:RNA methyltransferase [Lusitaniella coriacea LEGE 07157]|uniref:tRNA (cytidine/uridine-2'-O-)-methyltransferase TrmJ n=1 Tax=Lusitaniella coriacea LEGE 07157 TaxID=945747 RepID=A0A8J7DW58_9CYAN|nr:RNA methyltransferase [Lusitaniella coriacea]MBE9116138.1 RNA methyltransferase [Lusitaniella coriacea LEGE 07157]
MNLATNVRIVLVEPAGALNVGAIARVMKNMGLYQLVLVNPQCDPLGEEARRMAVHGGEVLEGATRFENLPEALEGCQRAIATTARDRHVPLTLETPKQVLPWCLEGSPTALIFGPEYRGLSNQELNYAQRFLGIPSNPEYPSLNLAQAVAVCVYELYQLSQNNLAVPPQTTEAARLEDIEGYYQHLESTLLKIGYLQPHTATARMAKFRRLYNRASLSHDEVALLRGILRQVEWAIKPQAGDAE